MKNPWIFPAAALAVGAVGGYISGKNSGGTELSKTEERDAAIRTRPTSRDEKSASAKAKAPARKSTEEIARMPGNSDRIKSMIDYYASLTPGQLEEEARKLESLPMNERMMAAFLLFGRWGEVDATAAMNFTNTMGFAGGFARPMVLQSWASTDPAGAAQYLQDNPREFAMMNMMGGGRGPMGGNSPAGIIASEWAKQDPEAAMKWAAGLETGGDQAKNSVVSEVAKSDPKKAIEMLGTMEGDKSRAYESIAASYATTDFAATKAWVLTLPAEDREGALGSAIRSLSNTDPQTAAREVSSMADGEEKQRAVADIAGDLARQDPAKAAEFVKTQNAEAQQDAMREIMPTWVSQDATAALSFANTLQGKTRDEALQSYVMSNNTGNPADLVKVAETISDEGDRSRSVGMAAARWMREDADAAKAYIQSSSTISERVKQGLLDGRGPWGGFGGGRGRGGR